MKITIHNGKSRPGILGISDERNNAIREEIASIVSKYTTRYVLSSGDKHPEVIAFEEVAKYLETCTEQEAFFAVYMMGRLMAHADELIDKIEKSISEEGGEA